MIDIINTGQPIQLSGKSGEQYAGTIYNKESHSTLTGPAIVCLTISTFANHQWSHSVNAIYRTDDTVQSMEEFKNRGDVSHLIVIPIGLLQYGKRDMVDDLIRQYLHGRTTGLSY
jgi:hypothetical protein